jgi:hypothetical protein
MPEDPEDVIVITPKGMAHKGVRHSSGPVETQAACHMRPPLSADTDTNTIVPASEFKKSMAEDRCKHCFGD